MLTKKIFQILLLLYPIFCSSYEWWYHWDEKNKVLHFRVLNSLYAVLASWSVMMLETFFGSPHYSPPKYLCVSSFFLCKLKGWIFFLFLLKSVYEHNQSMSLYIQIAVLKESSGSYHWRNIIRNLLNKGK